MSARRTARRGRRAAAPLAAGLLLALGASLAPPVAAQDDGEGADPGVAPIDFTIVVDQSDSLSEEDLRREVDAATTIAQAELSERSRATVIGFGSAEEEGQVAAVEACQGTELDAAGRQRISECVRALADPNREVIGPGTDHPAALAQAVDRLVQGDEETPRVVFLLTDGRLDVRDSLNYGGSPEARQRNARDALGETLARARENRVQIWPLGFGEDIDEEALAEMAAGGYVEGCAELPDAVPEMTVVGASGDLLEALQRTFAAARCAAVEIGESGVPPVDLEVTIPPIATDGSITVAKGVPGVDVTYYDPDGREVPEQGEFDGSTFEVSGRNTAVEALRVSDPKPGTWRVHLAPGGEGPPREAAVSAIWQGRLLSSVTVQPPSPSPGERVLVEARLQTRENVTIDDPELVAGIRASALLTGDGFAPVPVPLGDEGAEGDRDAGDLVFSGEFTVPEEATGQLVFTSEMAAPGVVADERPFYTRATQGPPAVDALVTFDEDEAHPGGTVAGTLRVGNTDGQPHDLRLESRDTGEGGVRVAPAEVRVGPGSEESVPFTVTFGEDAPLGSTGGVLAVVDASDGDRVVHEAFLEVTVTAPPTWWDRYRWAVIAGALVAAALGAWVAGWRAATRRRKQLGGHRVALLQSGHRIDEQLIRDRPRVFHFRVERGTGGRPTLVVARSAGASVYELRRGADGALRLKPPRGQERAVPAGVGLPVDDDTEVVVRSPDPRTTAPGRRSFLAPRPAKRPRPAAGPGAPGPGTDHRTDF
ncbi:von Willebrand factor type A domain-containing protein [Streptomyces zhaozhouensis]|uniref:von Willebrand factor type A domain-containing protein n=1 Tax=Streptomyces zhaozhouensis TaxID=1300267 RepID=A0A286DX86_9ACTN|nr:vWA domain-containing protein [Streptomyces zhaozhouensis]SOD63240.1 von Willebrand factor type A domain-containing protein [Streptomyces zhaozhouensis]